MQSLELDGQGDIMVGDAIASLKNVARQKREQERSQAEQENAAFAEEAGRLWRDCLTAFKADWPCLAHCVRESIPTHFFADDDGMPRVPPSLSSVQVYADVPGHSPVSMLYRLRPEGWRQEKGDYWRTIRHYSPNLQNPSSPIPAEESSAYDLGECLVFAEEGYAEQQAAIAEAMGQREEKAKREYRQALEERAAGQSVSVRLERALKDWLVESVAEAGFVLGDEIPF